MRKVFSPFHPLRVERSQVGEPPAPNPITGTGPVLGALMDGDTLSDAVTPGSYSSTAGAIEEPVPMQMQVDGGGWVTYVGSTEVSTGEVWSVRETPSDGTNSRTYTSAQQVVQAVPATAPAAFTSGQWTATGGNQLIAVTVSALPDDGGSAITGIEYRLDGWSWVSSGISTTGSFNITGRTNGVEYDVELRAVNGVGNGAASDTKSVTPAHWPSAFSSAQWTATPGDGSITIAVSALPNAQGSPITSLRYRLNNGPLADLPGDLSGGTITGLSNGTSYNVQISAVNAVGRGNWSDTKAVTPVASIPVPENVTPPAITGDLIDGETLSLSAGTWTPTPDEVERQWLADASPVGSSSTLDLTGREGEVISARTRARMTGGEWSEWEAATGGGEVQPIPQTYALVGNSLFNFGLGHSVASILAELAHPTDTVVQQITFNQSLTTNWDNPAGRTTGIDVKAYLASDSADFLGMVDLPGINDSLVDPAVAVVDWWQQADNADLRGTFYQMWYPIPDFDTTPNWVLWKAFITFLRPHHDRVLYDVRAALGGPEVLLAPVADVLVAVYDDRVALGVDFADFWYDALHINELGYYVAAITHWAVMHQQSPVGLPWSFSPAISGLDATLAADLQALVWAVVNADAYAKPGTWPSTVIPAAFTSGQWTATAGDTLISIGIGSLPNTGGASITDIEYELNASGTWISSGGTGNFNITALTNTTSYDVRIRAKNSVGSGRRSDMKARTPVTSATAPAAFTSGQWSVTRGNQQIAVTVSALPNNGGSTITAIQYRVGGGSWTASGLSNTGSFNITGLTNGTSYNVELRAANAIGNGSASDTKSATPAAVPGTLTSGNWTATAGVDKIDVVVTTPPSDGGSTITDYEYELNASGSWVSGGGATFSITGLTRGTAYAVRVRAKNSVGAASPSDSKPRTPPWQCSLTSALFDFGGGDGFRGAGFPPWALNFGSKNREPIPGVTLIGAYYFTVNGETFIAFQGDQRSILDGMSVYINSTEYAGTWVYNASSDYGVPATILVSAAGDIPVGTRTMEIRASSEVAEGTAVVGNSDEVTAFGETFTFSESVDYGYDQIGRPFIVAVPGLQLIARTTTPATIDAQPVHGTMLNPVFAGQQGWDGRIANYNSGLNQSLPLNLTAGDIVLAAIGGATPTGGTDPTRKGYMSKLIPIYVVADAWNTNAIGPAEIGWTGRPTPEPEYVDCMAAAAALPAYDISGFVSTPDKADLLPRVQRVNIGQTMTGSVVSGGYQQLTTQGSADGGRTNYGSHLADTEGKADLLLISNGLTAEEKATLLAWRIAHGMMYDTHVGAGFTHPSDGGHWQGLAKKKAIALYYTGRDDLLATLASVSGGNEMIQPFLWTSAMLAELAPHSDMNKIWLGRLRTVSAVSGDVVTITTNTTGGLGDPPKFAPAKLMLVRQLDDARWLVTAQEDPDNIAAGIGDFDLTIPGHGFAVGNTVYFAPPFEIEEGDADWRITALIRSINPSVDASYRQENKFVDDVLPLRGMGIWHDDWQALEEYTSRAEFPDEPTLAHDYPSSSYDAFSATFWSTHGPAILAKGRKPLILSRPVVSGIAEVGAVLTASAGGVAGDGVTGTWQWTADGVDVSGATASTYTVQSGDLGKVMRVRQIATNADGATSILSAATDSVEASYTVNAVEFDGTNDLLHASGLTATPESGQGTLVFSFYVVGATIPASGTSMLAIKAATSDRLTVKIQRNTGGSPPTDRGYLAFAARNSSNTAVVVLNSANGSIFPGHWYTVALSWNTATQTLHRKIRDNGGAWADLAHQGTPVVTLDALVDDMNALAVGATNSGGSGRMPNWYGAEVWFAPGQYMDLSDPAVLAKLMPAVSKGSDGSIPTGSPPWLYLSGATDNWHINKGTVAGMTEVGALTTAPSAPT